MSLFSFFKSKPAAPASIPPRLASVRELESPRFRTFMETCNHFAAENHLREFTNWSKVWEYPWLYYHGIENIDWKGKRLIDFGSEISPLPWLLARRGASVTLIETDRQWLFAWEKLRSDLAVDVSWHFVSGEQLPLPDAFADAVTSFSVIEHQPNKRLAIDEIARVMKPSAPLFLSFDICEPSMGMTFPDWNGRALTMHEFEREIWRHPAFGNQAPLHWNVEDIPEFKRWHLQSASHHNYVVGASVLYKR